MAAKHTRKLSRPKKPAEFYVLILEQDAAFAQALKFDLEKRLPVNVVTVHSLSAARLLLKRNPHHFFLSVSSVMGDCKQIDLLKSFNIPVIAIIGQYEDELRDKLIKKHVLDYVVKTTSTDTTYICDLIARIFKNRSIKVLVIDDSKVSQFVIARELALQKFQVMQVDNGKAAADILEKNTDIKLILVDYHMKSVDGITFVKEIRETYPKDRMLIIGMSTSTDDRLAVKFLKAGANDFIHKPFNYEMMLCRINQNLDMLDAVEYAKQLSNVDYLSNAYNRRYFFEYGNQIVREMGEDDVLTVIMIDIDNFKHINDVYGHDIGDEVIKDIAAALKQYFAKDIVARMGGEEFAVLSTSPQYLNSFDRIKKFREKIANQVLNIKGHIIKYTCSIGVSGYAGKNLDDMLVHADRLLYLAKQNGRNRMEGEPLNRSNDVDLTVLNRQR
jgi:diguanylate cyclase (GGDEF)-like protein